MTAAGRHPPPIAVRAAAPADAGAVAELNHESARELYDRYASGSGRAARIIAAAVARPGNTASLETVLVAEVGGAVAGALAAFPVAEAERRAHAFLRLTLARLPPWRWPAAIGVFRRSAGGSPPPPGGALYIDALATDPAHRRRGVAAALLHAAEERARELGLEAVALDTEAGNRTAQRVYERAGFERVGERAPSAGMPGFAGYVKRI